MEPDEKAQQSVVEDEEDNGGGFSNYLRVFRYADRQAWTLNGIALIAAIGAGVPLPLMDIIFGQFVTAFVQFSQGRYTPDEYMDVVTKHTLYFIYLFVAKFVLVYVHTVCISMAAIRTTKALRIDFMTSLLRQEIAYFDSKEAGSPSVKVTSTANLINQGISEKLSLTVQCISTFVAAFVIAFAVQWKLTLITIGIVPAIIVVTTICVGIDSANEAKLLSIYSRAGLMAEEVFSSIATVHSFWLHPEMAKRYDTLLADAEKEGLKKRPNLGILYSFEFFAVFAGYGLAFWQGVRMYASGEIATSGKVVTVIFAVIVAATTLTQIAPQIIVLSKAISASKDLFKTIDRQSKIDSLSTRGKRPSGCSGTIKVTDVRFAYPSRPDDEVLRGLNLEILAGKTTALVGASGSGKSTIIGLLERWYEQSRGVITIDGIDIRDLDIQWLRQNIRLVQQEPVLFSGTVFDNVAYGLIGTEHENSSREEKMKLVEQACIDAFADQFIQKLPQGYSTNIGERARMLSGGQKQRIAIARSIISNPPILLLDEATSALDPKAEQIVQRALNNVSVNRTTITIAHKLSTIRDADSIAVLSKGVVIEQGSHHDLLSRKTAYYRLVNAQSLGGSKDSTRDDDESDDDGEVDRMSLARTRSERMDIDPDEASEDENEEKESMHYGLLKCIWILLKNEPDLWPHFFITACCCVLGGGTYPAQAVLFSRTFGVFELQDEDRMRNRGDFWALMFFVVALANLVIYFVVGWVTTIISQKLTRRYRLRLLKSTIHQNMEFFDQASHASGGMTSRLSNTATNVQELLGMNIGLILLNVVNVTSSSIFGIIIGWKLGLVCVFGALPPLILCGYLRIRLETALDDATSTRFASSAAVAAEAISAIRTVASLTLERTILSNYEGRLANVATKATKALVWTMFWYALTQSLSFLAMALGFWYGGKLVSTGEYNTTQFFAVFIAVIFGGEATAAFFQYTTSITRAQTGANFMFWLENRAPKQDLLDSPSSFPDEKDGRGPAAIGYDDLKFSYPSRPNIAILQGIDVTIPPGKFAAFVGSSGCGKTTMISLLSRFYDPTAGTITINDQSITSLTPRQHRRRLALVQQEPVLYQGSIRDNVALGLAESRAATEAEIEKACAQANILDFVQSLPEGLNTSVGMRGSQLSGGQRQRVAIARAIIRNPSVLLLDEATSALDTESEKIVQAALMEAAQEGSRTTVAVAHRLSTIRDADYIFVFEAGKIVEAGNHSTLLQQKGRYYQMCQGQALDRTA